MSHVSNETLELFVMGQLPAEASGPFEQHLAGCEHCAQRLARSAELELSLRALARQRRCGTAAPLRWPRSSYRPAIRAALTLGAMTLGLLAGARLSAAPVPSHETVQVQAAGFPDAGHPEQLVLLPSTFRHDGG